MKVHLCILIVFILDSLLAQLILDPSKFIKNEDENDLIHTDNIQNQIELGVKTIQQKSSSNDENKDIIDIKTKAEKLEQPSADQLTSGLSKSILNNNNDDTEPIILVHKQDTPQFAITETAPAISADELLSTFVDILSNPSMNPPLPESEIDPTSLDSSEQYSTNNSVVNKDSVMIASIESSQIVKEEETDETLTVLTVRRPKQPLSSSSSSTTLSTHLPPSLSSSDSSSSDDKNEPESITTIDNTHKIIETEMESEPILQKDQETSSTHVIIDNNIADTATIEVSNLDFIHPDPSISRIADSLTDPPTPTPSFDQSGEVTGEASGVVESDNRNNVLGVESHHNQNVDTQQYHLKYTLSHPSSHIPQDSDTNIDTVADSSFHLPETLFSGLLEEERDHISGVLVDLSDGDDVSALISGGMGLIGGLEVGEGGEDWDELEAMQEVCCILEYTYMSVCMWLEYIFSYTQAHAYALCPWTYSHNSNVVYTYNI